MDAKFYVVMDGVTAFPNKGWRKRCIVADPGPLGNGSGVPLKLIGSPNH